MPELKVVRSETDAEAYDRKSMAMAHVMMVVRQRGDTIPNSYDMQCYDLFVATGTQMMDPPEGSLVSVEANLRLVKDDTFSEPMAKIIRSVETLRENATSTTQDSPGEETGQGLRAVVEAS